MPQKVLFCSCPLRNDSCFNDHEHKHKMLPVSQLESHHTPLQNAFRIIPLHSSVLQSVM